MEFALLLQACLLMSTLERFSYDVLIWFFWGFFLFSAGVLLCCCEQKLILSHKSCFCSPNEMTGGVATGKATPKQGTIMFQQNSVQGLFLLFFFKCILGSGCFYCCQKVASLESWTCGCNRVSFVDQLVLLCAIHLTFTLHLHKWRKK